MTPNVYRIGGRATDMLDILADLRHADLTIRTLASVGLWSYVAELANETAADAMLARLDREGQP